MQTNNQNKDKLIPLRKFSVPGIYSSSYLSQLVQRNKLKAVKIGRNYFTCQKWFNQYLDMHARDEKQAEYSRFLIKQKGSEKFSAKHKIFYLKTVAIVTVFFIAAILVNFLIINYFKDSGQVAGVEERGEIATSTTRSNSD